VSWTELKLGDLYKVSSSKRVLKSDWKSEGVPFYRGREISSLSKYGYVENDLYITEEMYKEFSENFGVPVANDIMVTAIGTIGNTYIVKSDDKFYFKDASVLWLKKVKDVDSNFVNYWFKSTLFTNQLDVGLGATVDTLTIGKVQSLKINTPSLVTQKKIVTKLDAIFAEIDKASAAAEANATNAESLFQSYLTNIFENNASLTKKLKDCCLIKPPKKESRILNDSDTVSFMPMEALGINYKFAIPNQERKLSDVSGSYTYFAEGDVLLAKITPCFENGKLGIAKDLTNRIGFGSSEYIVFRPNHDVDSSWLYYFLNRSVFRENGAKHMSGAVGHKRVTREFIEDSLLPVPSIDKQKLLVADIENVLTFTKSLLSSSKNKVHELSILKKSILSKAFNGELVKE
jgi:type I restriction enzyme S subunit